MQADNAASWHERMGPELQRFGRAIYDNGYAEGLRGEPYSGATFIGYYGWCDGRDRRAS